MDGWMEGPVGSRVENRLSARAIMTAGPGRYPDGGGLYLDVDGDGRRRWLWRYRRGDKRRDMGLGSLSQVSLKEARQQRDRWRAVLREGKDPIDERARPAIEAPTVVTFGQAADEYIQAHSAGWRNLKHRAQWEMTLSVHARRLWAKPGSDITTADILATLRPIWTKIPETAARVRGRIEMVLDAERALGHIDESKANPARWRGHLNKLLAVKKLTRAHHAAMPFADVPAFVQWLRKQDTIAARALELTILTAARTSEVMGAKAEEFDLQSKVWTIPAQRMKAGREHRVPLCGRAVEIVNEQLAFRATRNHKSEGYLFPGRKQGAGLSTMTFTQLLRRAQYPYTTHGFRSSFADWCGDATSFPRELSEAALSHIVGDATERAYRRGDALDRRRGMMEAWAAFLDNDRSGNVIRFPG
jgi:integrase